MSVETVVANVQALSIHCLGNTRGDLLVCEKERQEASAVESVNLLIFNK